MDYLQLLQTLIRIIVLRIAAVPTLIVLLRYPSVALRHIAGDVHPADGSPITHVWRRRWIETNIQIGCDSEICREEDRECGGAEPQLFHKIDFLQVRVSALEM